MNLEQRYAEVLQQRKTASLLRALPPPSRQVNDFTHNDYLGLSQHPIVVESAIAAAKKYGLGGKASRLLGAQADRVRELESAIARDVAVPGAKSAAIVMPTGFQLNTTVISTLLNPDLLGAKPIVFTDRLIHASVHSGIRLARARQNRFAHNDMGHLERLLMKKAVTESPVFVFVESCYGMDGDLAPLKRLYELKARYRFRLYIDEAHSIGLLGPRGMGLAQCGPEQADFVVGTFSKAIGAAGGYIVCPPEVRDIVVNFGHGLIYSTAPSPVVMAAAHAAWKLLPQLSAERKKIHALADYLRNRLNRIGWNTGASASHIIPVIIGDAEKAVQIQERLAHSGFQVACIRPPTVEQGKSRLRISLNASHTQSQIAKLVDLLGPPPNLA